MYYWFMLSMAIITEVISTSFMKMAVDNSPMLGYGIMAIFISLSYYCLAQAVKKIPLAIAYTMWEGLGLLLISLVSWLVFDEVFALAKIMAIAALLTGLILMNIGEKLSEQKNARAKDSTLMANKAVQAQLPCTTIK